MPHLCGLDLIAPTSNASHPIKTRTPDDPTRHSRSYEYLMDIPVLIFSITKNINSPKIWGKFCRDLVGI